VTIPSEMDRDIRPENFARDVFGFGIAYRFRVDTRAGRVVTSSGIDHVEDSLRRIIAYCQYEYPGRPDFGAGLREEVFSVRTSGRLTAICRRVKKAVDEFEPRVKNTVVRGRYEDDNVMVITMTYTLTSTNERRSMVFPMQQEQNGFMASQYGGEFV